MKKLGAKKEEKKTETPKEKYKQKNFTGALFENTKKTTDKHPDLTGSITIEDTEFWVSGWNNTSKGGKEYIALTFKVKEDK